MTGLDLLDGCGNARPRANKRSQSVHITHACMLLRVSIIMERVGLHYTDYIILYTLSSLWVFRTGSASDWCALQEAYRYNKIGPTRRQWRPPMEIGRGWENDLPRWSSVGFNFWI